MSIMELAMQHSETVQTFEELVDVVAELLDDLDEGADLKGGRPGRPRTS
jgi:hypothetical protein